MTEEHNLEESLQFFRDLLRPAPDGAATLEELSQGFTEQRAQQVLDDPDLLHHLRLLASRVELGPGWTMQALNDDAPASSKLYLIALAERPDRSQVPVEILRDGEATLLRPATVAVDPEQLARIDLPGGWAAWHPVDPHDLPVVGLDGPEIPDWVAPLLSMEVCEDIAAGCTETTISTLYHEPHPLSRYALGQWLRHQPMLVLPDSVLRVELGALAVEHADLLGGLDPARDLLTDAGPLLVDLFGIVAGWEPPRRRLALADLRRITTATLTLTPELPEAAVLRELLTGATPSSQGTHVIQDAYALAAGGLPDDAAGGNPLAKLVIQSRLEALEHLDDGVDLDDDLDRPFIAELIALG